MVEEELRETFEIFDKDKNGHLTSSDLRAVMKSIGEELTDKELEITMKEYDNDHDGCINCEGYYKNLKKKKFF